MEESKSIKGEGARPAKAIERKIKVSSNPVKSLFPAAVGRRLLPHTFSFGPNLARRLAPQLVAEGGFPDPDP